MIDLFREILENLEISKEDLILFHDKKLFEIYKKYENCSNVKEYLIKAFALFFMKKYYETITIIENLLSVNNDNLKKTISYDLLFEILGICYFQIKNYLKATENFTKSIEINPDNLESRINLANIFIITKNYEKALNILTTVLEKEPHDSKVRQNIENLKIILKIEPLK